MDGQLSCQLELFNYVKLYLIISPTCARGRLAHLGRATLELMKSLVPEPLSIIFRFGKMHSK